MKRGRERQDHGQVDKPRGILDELARSGDVRQRRTAVLATQHFLRRGEGGDTSRIAGALLDDDHDLIDKAAGGVLREAGKHDRARLLQFLEDNAAAMPRTMLRYACEHLDQKERVDQKERAHYRAVTRSAATDEARR